MARGTIALDQIQGINQLGDGSRLATTDGSYTAGNIPAYDSVGKLVDSGIAAGSSGTVTSIAVTVPSRQSVSGSPVTGSGTIAITDNTQSANQVLAGPSSGSAAAPTFRALAAADLPLATTGAFGAVKPDGTTVTISGGVISVAASLPTGAGVVYNGTSNPGSGTLPSVVQSRAVSNASSLAFSSNVASGNLLIVVASDFSADMSTATLSDTLGTSYSAAITPAANSLTMRIFYGIAPSSGANSVTVAGYTVGGWQNVQILEVSNAQAVLDGTSVSAGGAAPGSLTTTSANSFVIVGLAGSHNATSWTQPSGWSIVQANGHDAGGIAWETLSGTASVSPTFTGTSVSDGLVGIVAFKAVTSTTVGSNNDFFVNTADNQLFGPKASGAWPASALPLLAYVAAPTTHSSTGAAGQVAYDGSGNFYWCYAVNTWARIGPGGYSNTF